MISLIPVILCGGIGSRLWPLSRSNYPKQFLKSLAGDQSLFMQTLLRLDQLKSDTQFKIERAVIVASEAHRFLLLDQLHELGKHCDIILEPEGKNTAPSLCLAALHIQQNYPQNSIMLVLPADHFIDNQSIFAEKLTQASALAYQQKAIVTLGIQPKNAATAYGYIQNQKTNANHRQVVNFVEKPDKATAEQYLQSGDYAWNSGIFILSAELCLAALQQFAKDIYQSAQLAWQQHKLDPPFLRPLAEQFARCPSQSIDYAVMEHAAKALPMLMLELDCGWNDLGTWQAVLEQAENNAHHGDVLAIDSQNCYVSANHRLVATLGLQDLIIIETADAVLVAHKDHSQDIGKIVNELKAQQREEPDLHRKVYRPWGWYDSIDEGDRFKVKRICVKPKASLSLQKHHHRAEHWVVVQGTAEVTCGERVQLLSENQSSYIPLGETHRLRNPGTIPLEIIEVQSGSYLGEDDIVRLDDVYGRAEN